MFNNSIILSARFVNCLKQVFKKNFGPFERGGERPVTGAGKKIYMKGCSLCAWGGLVEGSAWTRSRRRSGTGLKPGQRYILFLEARQREGSGRTGSKARRLSGQTGGAPAGSRGQRRRTPTFRTDKESLRQETGGQRRGTSAFRIPGADSEPRVSKTIAFRSVRQKTL